MTIETALLSLQGFGLLVWIIGMIGLLIERRHAGDNAGRSAWSFISDNSPATATPKMRAYALAWISGIGMFGVAVIGLIIAG